MLIRKIVLSNFGLYGGRNEFDLVPRVKYRRKRPIILFGGKNGAGKTTLLESVRLALYGRTSLGSRVRQVDYDSYLRGRIHRARGDLLQVNEASVAVEFDYVRAGEKKTYRIERSWQAKSETSLEEHFQLLEDGQPVSDVDQEVAEAFVREIVPEGLSQLFFFDGEKIRELAEDDTGDEVLAQSIKALLGLDMVERLSADLAIYASRQATDSAAEKDQERLVKIHTELQQLETSRDDFEEELADIGTKINSQESLIEQQEDTLRMRGAGFAKHRDELKSRETRATTTITQIEADVRTACENLLPIALCPKTTDGVMRQIESEQSARQRQNDSRAAKAMKAELMAQLRRVIDPVKSRAKAVAQLAEGVESTVDAFFSERIGSGTEDGSNEFLGLSEAESAAIRAHIEQASQIRQRVLKAGRQLEREYRVLQETRLQIERIPNEDQLADVLTEIQRLNRVLGELHQRQREMNDQLDAVMLQRAELDRRRIRLEEQIGKKSDVAGKLDRVDRIRSALDQYLNRLTEQKVADLRRAVVDCFNRLARKGDVIHDIKIDPRTFSATLFDQTGTPIPKAELSSGEKQIYAIAMLWGLARTSGRPLPIIIDTPLGRLDSEHRAKLCEIYFPNASHQVILLSTDTEVEQNLFKTLSPNVSHSYHLQFDREQVRTSASEEYFWREPTNV